MYPVTSTWAQREMAFFCACCCYVERDCYRSSLDVNAEFKIMPMFAAESKLHVIKNPARNVKLSYGRDLHLKHLSRHLCPPIDKGLMDHLRKTLFMPEK
jgi:hypothetical protein